jgi:rubrerythrin
MAKKSNVNDRLHELLYQALQTEQGGIKVYEAAIKCAVHDDLREEWEKYLDETRTHEQILLEVFSALGLDPDAMSAGRSIVEHIGNSLVQAIEMAKASSTPEDAQIVAAECVVQAETKDHMNWELLGKCAESANREVAKVLKAAHAVVENEEDHHLYHTKGWTRELWIDSLGMPAVLPPPEEIKQVETAIGASRAEQARDDMLKRN